MNNTSDSTVSEKFTTVIPKKIRKLASIENGDTLSWSWDAEKKEITIKIVPQNITKTLYNLGQQNNNEV